MSFLTKIFGEGTKAVVDSVGSVLDNLITNKEELEAAKLEAAKEINRHLEAMQGMAHRGNELENADRASARDREVAHIKATGKADHFQYFVGGVVMVCFVGVVVFLLNKSIPKENDHVIVNLIGILEGAVISVITFYFGSARTVREK